MAWIPELLAPAGNLEKCKIALLYGADAVYLSGQKFGLRAASANLCESELIDAVTFAHHLQKKVYVTLNGFLHQQDLEELPEFVRFLEQIQVDAVIISDLGVFHVVHTHSQIPIHISTQASVVNQYSAKLWKQLGAKRIIVGRELTLQEGYTIHQEADVEVEMFIHGAMCMSYSGHCTISNYTAGRDSNRGGCKQSCRFEYQFQTEEPHQAYFMSSKDLNGIRLLPEFSRYRIASLKIEGRMKSNLYVATLTRAYRMALDRLQDKGTLTEEELDCFSEMTEDTSHREYTEASLEEKAGVDSILNINEERSRYLMVGTLLEVNDSFALASVKNAVDLSQFKEIGALEVLPFHGDPISIPFETLSDITNYSLQKLHPSMVIRFPASPQMKPLNVIRVAHAHTYHPNFS